METTVNLKYFFVCLLMLVTMGNMAMATDGSKDKKKQQASAFVSMVEANAMAAADEEVIVNVATLRLRALAQNAEQNALAELQQEAANRAALLAMVQQIEENAAAQKDEPVYIPVSALAAKKQHSEHPHHQEDSKSALSE